ncbi:MAG: hypothetical protein ACJ79K_08120 [Gemmatimonadaceae bacterium]
MTRTSLYRGVTVASLACLCARGASAQGASSLQATVDLEAWSTDSGSALLARNHGRPAGLARLRLAAATEPWTGLVAYVQAEASGGSATVDGTQFELEQAGVRYTRARALVFDAGVIPHIVGAFASRRSSTRNPLIGEPDGYAVLYPMGARISGKMTYGDYRLGVVSLPIYNDRYMPEPTPAAHLAIGGGITPVAGVRIGVSATQGPWLRDDMDAATLRGRRWQSYDQRVVAFDAELSRGYADFHGELTHGWHEVPGHSRMLHGAAWYAELAYALSPRVFAAARAEENDYPYLRPFGTFWGANDVRVSNGEVGLGYRVGADQTLKLTYRRDHWDLAPAAGVLLPDGHSIAMQLTTAFDVLGALDRLRSRRAASVDLPPSSR